MARDDVASKTDAPRPTQPTLMGLGHARRKAGRLHAAEEAYTAALGLRPRSGAALAALGFTAQLRRDPARAVELYHQALASRPDDR